MTEITFRVGLIGYGNWARMAYVPALRRDGRAQIVSRYAGQPEAIQKALPYRDDLTEADFNRLAGALAYVRWPDPLTLK